jgi:hypothetical protein
MLALVSAGFRIDDELVRQVLRDAVQEEWAGS